VTSTLFFHPSWVRVFRPFEACRQGTETRKKEEQIAFALKQREEENRKLKQLVADLSVDKASSMSRLPPR